MNFMMDFRGLSKVLHAMFAVNVQRNHFLPTLHTRTDDKSLIDRVDHI